MTYYVCLFEMKLLDNDMKKIETCRSLSGLYVKVHL